MDLDYMLKRLSEIYYGVQNEKIDSLKPIEPTFEKIYETKTITLTRDVSKRVLYEMPTSDVPNIGYANFKLISPSYNLDSIQFEVGGQRIDTPALYKFLNHEPKLYLMSENRCVPNLEWHHISILFDTKNIEDVVFSYDIVEVSNPSKFYEYFCKVDQYTGEEQLTALKSSVVLENGSIKLKCDLNYNHLINRIYAFLPEDTTDVRLILDGQDYNLVFTKEQDYYMFDFGKTPLNFSRIDHACVSFVCKNVTTDSVCNIVAVSTNIMRIMSGMMGSAFSK
jgi:hypothetical protein